jgi:4-amino-4-deoxy-L-arabinose transferase-like glycosyltransferase
LLAALFPWTPMIAVLFRPFYRDARARYLLSWFCWGFLLFSIAVNKLPGYLLPLLPAAAALLGVAMSEMWDRSRELAVAFALSAAMLACLPAIQELLPQTLVAGLSRTRLDFPLGFVFPAALLGAACAALELSGSRRAAVGLIVLGITAGVVGFVFETYPMLDRIASPRVFWRSHSNSVVCVPTENRSWRYGLSYYAGRNLPDCN